MRTRTSEDGEIFGLISVVNLCILSPNLEEILLIRRQKPPFKGLWGMPGGKVEENETPYSASSRELREETGIIQKPRFPIGLCYERVFENGQVKYVFSINILKFVTKARFRNGKEGRLDWFAVSQLRGIDIIPSDPYMIQAFCFNGVNYATSVISERDGKYNQESFCEWTPKLNIVRLK